MSKTLMSPAEGIYLDAAKSYKGLMGAVYMSNDLIFDDKTYNIVGIFPLVLGKNLKRFLVVNDMGEVVKDKDLSWKCLQIYEFFVVMKTSEKLLTVLREDMDYLNEIEPHLDGIINVLNDYVNDLVKEDMVNFKSFFKNNVESNLTMHEYTKEIWPLYQSYLSGKPIDYKNDFIDFKNLFIKFFELNCQRSIWLLENALSRRVVESMLLSKDKIIHLSLFQREIVNKIVKFLYGCHEAEKNLAYTVPSFKNFEQAIVYLKDISGDFTITNANKTFNRWVGYLSSKSKNL
jgi:hypothetical protein